MNLGVQNDHCTVPSITKQSEHTARTAQTRAKTMGIHRMDLLLVPGMPIFPED